MDYSEEKWYVLQVMNGKEKKVSEGIKKLSLKSFSCFLPFRKIKEKKDGVLIDKVIPLYPGYLFIIGFWDQLEAKTILHTTDVFNFVGNAGKPGYLQQEEIEVIRTITVEGIVDFSQAVKEGNKIRIISGPLKKLEGVIESVDRRKQRAVVNLPLLGTHIKITLGFDYMDEPLLS